MTDINIQDLHKLLVYFSKNTYRAKDADCEVNIRKKTNKIHLFKCPKKKKNYPQFNFQLS